MRPQVVDEDQRPEGPRFLNHTKYSFNLFENVIPRLFTYSFDSAMGSDYELLEINLLKVHH